MPEVQEQTVGRRSTRDLDAFRPLHNRGFRLYFGGQLASMCGSWAQTTALAWFVLKLTGDAEDVGRVLAIQFVPVVLLSAWAGAVADRVDTKRGVLLVQSQLGMQATLLAVIVLTDTVRLWMLYPLAVVQGVGLAFDTPIRQSLVGRIVGTEHLRSALSLNGGLVQLARVVGPVMAGLLIDGFGVGICFVINAVSYGVVIVAVSAIDVAPKETRTVKTVDSSSAWHGIRFAWSTPELRDALLLALLMGLMGANFTVGLPAIVREEFGNNAKTLGFLLAAHGVGALFGVLRTASKSRPTKGNLILGVVVLGIAYVACSFPSSAIVLVPGVAVAGLVGLFIGVTLNAALQLGAPPEMRGRIIGLYFMIAFGSNVIGAPLIGRVAETWSPRFGFGLGAVFALATAGVLALRWGRRLDEPPVCPT